MWYQEWRRSYDILHKEIILSEWRTEITPTQTTKKTEEPDKGRLCYVTSVVPDRFTEGTSTVHSYLQELPRGERIHRDSNSLDHECLLLIPETLHCHLWFLEVQVGNQRKGHVKWTVVSMWMAFNLELVSWTTAYQNRTVGSWQATEYSKIRRPRAGQGLAAVMKKNLMAGSP